MTLIEKNTVLACLNDKLSDLHNQMGKVGGEQFDNAKKKAHEVSSAIQAIEKIAIVLA